MKKILFLSPYPLHKAPSQRLKYEQYYGYIEEAGYEISTQSFVSNDFWNILYASGRSSSKLIYALWAYFKRFFFIIFNIRKFDVVYVHLWVAPAGPPLLEYLVVRMAKRLIYDIDDLVYLKPSNKVNRFLSFLKSGENPIYLMKRADHVITCTPYLDQFVRKYNANTMDISSTINTELYRPKMEYTFREEKPVLGWSGSFSTSKYLYLLKDVLLRLKKDWDFKLLVMGDDSFEIEGIDVEALPWREEYEVATIERFDIGLYPLPDEEWVLGKSGLKALQYMALGVPTIAQAIGANFRVIEDGVSGILVNDQEAWYQALKNLLLDKSRRASMGQAGAKRVEELYSLKANKDKYLKVITGS